MNRVTDPSKDQLLKTLEQSSDDVGRSKKPRVSDADAQFRALIELSSQGVLVHRHFVPLYANEALADMYGYESVDEIMALSSTKALVSKQHLPHLVHEARLKGLQGHSDIDYKGRRKDGTEFWVSKRSFVIDWNGEPAVCSVRFDITEKKQAEEALRQTEIRFRNLFDHSPQGILVHRNHDPLYANRALALMYGFDSVDEVMALESTLTLIQEARRPGARKYHDSRLLKDTQISDHERVAIKKDGTEFPIATRSFRIDWADGPAICSFRHDITDHKNTEGYLQNAMAAFPHGFIMYDKNDRLAILNENFLRGRPGSEKFKIGKTFESILLAREASGDRRDHLGPDRMSMEERLKRHRNPKGPFLVKNADGRTLQFDEIKTPDGGTVTIQTDVTKLKEKERSLATLMNAAQEALRTKNILVADICRELKAPLNVVLGLSEMMENELEAGDGNGRSAQFNSHIREAASVLERTLNQVSLLSQIELGDVTARDDVANVEEAARNAIRQARDQAQAAHVSLTDGIAFGLPALRVDPAHLEAVLINLLFHSLKLTPARGRVTLTAGSDTEGGVVLTVADTGMGIPSQPPSSPARDADGTEESMLTPATEYSGLALALAHAFAEFNEGRFEVKSRLGRGTETSLRFPADCVAPAASGAARRRPK